MFKTDSLSFFVILVITSGVFALICEPRISATEPFQAPNVIFMMADDMGMGDTSAYQDFTGNQDSEQILTPNMNRLARMGVRFTDAHTPASRCTLTRYALLTGRYSWRNRLKHWVLFGVQGDPMIEADRPTLGNLFQSHGYRTALVGKWHVGLRYRNSQGRPADAWEDADLRQPMFDTPLDHGFDFCRFTSRSHGTSGPALGGKKKPNDASQSIGPGHIHGRTVIGATDDGKRIVDSGDNAYVLEQLGSRHLFNAKSFLSGHFTDHEEKPFFLYYACNSNHGPHTPEREIEGVSVAGAATNLSLEPMGRRADYVYENDVVLGSLLNYLSSQDDPRNPGNKLIENTIVVFTSDNGAEVTAKAATGPFRSNKGSVYEGGHRVPFLVSWPAGDVGDGNSETPGTSNATLLGLQDMYATFAHVLGEQDADLNGLDKGAEDSISVLDAWQGGNIGHRQMFFNDHKESEDHAVLAFRSDDPFVAGQLVPGAWKLFFDAKLVRHGKAVPIELYDLRTDPKEQRNLVQQSNLNALVNELTRRAVAHRTAGGHRFVEECEPMSVRLCWLKPTVSSSPEDVTTTAIDLRSDFEESTSGVYTSTIELPGSKKLGFTIHAKRQTGNEVPRFDLNPMGLGVVGGTAKQVDSGEKLCIKFNQDVLVESVSLVAGQGTCGGFYRKTTQSPLAIYCIDADIDSNDQSGILSDIGVLRRGDELILDSSPHFGVEAKGRWRLAEVNVRLMRPKSD
jgi:arylsulfatase A-like enzyme